MFWAEIWRISEFLSENFHFLVVKFSVYLNRHVFITLNQQKRENDHSNYFMINLHEKMWTECRDQTRNLIASWARILLSQWGQPHWSLVVICVNVKKKEIKLLSLCQKKKSHAIHKWKKKKFWIYNDRPSLSHKRSSNVCTHSIMKDSCVFAFFFFFFFLHSK